MERPDQDTQNLLISSPAHFVGEYETDRFLITHAWPQVDRETFLYGARANPYSRNYYMVSFRSSLIPVPQEGTPLAVGEMAFQPGIQPFADGLCIALSLLFGKRFDSHGFVQAMGRFHMPVVASPRPLMMYASPPYNDCPRTDFRAELNFSHIGIMRAVLDAGFANIGPHGDRFLNAGRFYLRALRTVHDAPELSFLDFVTAGEVLADGYVYSDSDIYDDKLLSAFQTIESSLANGTLIVADIKKRLRQVRRKYCLTLLHLLDNYFYERSESPGDFGHVGRLTRESMDQRLRASYDLRSRYLHTGIAFRQWLLPFGGRTPEVMPGRPRTTDSKLGKLLERSPTWIGMERVIRTCLLSYYREKVDGHRKG